MIKISARLLSICSLGMLLAATGCPSQKESQQTSAQQPQPAGSAPVASQSGETFKPDVVATNTGEVVLPSLQARLDEKREASQAPPEAIAASERMTQSLMDQHMLDNAVGLGNQAPDFTLDAIKGNPVNLAETYAGGPVILFFFRGGW